MACHEVQPWTLGGLLGAFFDLGLAYLLLCVSAFVFFASKFLKIFWLYLPCPCNGLLGYRNRDLCLHKLLIWPVTKIHAVQKLVKSRFPFGWFEDQRCNLNTKLIRGLICENRAIELEGEASSSPFSSPRLQNLVDRESGYDAKGKRVMILKKRSGIRRSRRAAPEYGKLPSFLPNDSSRSVARIFPFPCDDRDMRDTSGESSFPINGREDGLQDDVKAPTGDDMGERICQSSKLSGLVGESNGVDMSWAQEKAPIVGNETDTLRMLQEELEKEKVSCAALYLELEKERAASATAADEAMAMICRLQKDKASIEMEVRQYQRMMEEKFVYDEEEMDILKEILLRREMENHFLEKEVEAYRQMSYSGNERSDGDLSDMLCELGQRPSPSRSNADPLLMLQQTDDTRSNSTRMGNIADSTSQSEASFVEKQIHSNEHDLLDKCVLSTGEEKLRTGSNAMCQGMTTEASQTNIGIEKSFYCDGEEELQQDWDPKSNLHNSMLDAEPAVHDVHVIEGKTELWKEESRSSTYGALDESQDFSPTFGASGVWRSELLRDCPSTSRVDTEPKITASSLDTCCELPNFDNSRCKPLIIDSTKNSLSVVNSERLKIDTEVELLIERLKMLEERKEKLTSSSEHWERQKVPLKLWEETRNQLCNIQQLRDPVRQASLPPLSSKVNLKKRRCQSMSLEAHESTSS